jgi:cell division protein FtsW
MVSPKNTYNFRSIKSVGNYDWILLGIVVILSVLGLAFFASSLSTKGVEVFRSEFLHQLIFGVWMGGFLAYLMAKLDYHLLFKYKNYVLLSGLVMLVYIAVFLIFADMTGMSRLQLVRSVSFLPIRPYIANNAVRWIATPVSNFQPTELAKFTTLVYLSAFLNEIRDDITWLSLKRPLYVFALTAGLIIIQPDLGSILLIFGILISAMWVGKVPVKILSTIGLVMLCFALFFAFFTQYRFARIQAFFNQESASAFQVRQAKLAIQNGGWWGQGFGNSSYKSTIPEVSTDAILGMIGEEIGFILTLGFLGLYLLLFWRGLKIANQAPDVGGKVLATGISVWLVTQAFLNVAGITGLTPLKGLPLPFVSEGGSSLIINLMITGVLLNISSQSQTGIYKPAISADLKRLRFRPKQI